MQNADVIQHPRRAWLYGGLREAFQFFWPIYGRPERGRLPLRQPRARHKPDRLVVSKMYHSEHSDNETTFYEEVE